MPYNHHPWRQLTHMAAVRMLVAMFRIRTVQPANSKPVDAMPHKGPANKASTAMTLPRGTSLRVKDSA
jgi:hypothetical protein